MNRSAGPLELKLHLWPLTPMFTMGAGAGPEGAGAGREEPELAAELRAASLRGLLRYWFRALYGAGSETGPAMAGRAAGEREKRDAPLAASTLIERETLLFGSTGRSGIVRVFPAGPMPRPLQAGGDDWRSLFGRSQVGKPPGRAYLWYSAQLNDRACYAPARFRGADSADAPISLRLLVDAARLRRRELAGWTPEAALGAIGRTLAAWSSLSGIGLRSRRAAGAFELTIAGQGGPTGDVELVAGPLRAVLQGMAESRRADDAARLLRDSFIAGGTEKAGGQPRFHVLRPGRALVGAWADPVEGFDSWQSAADTLANLFARWRSKGEPNATIVRKVASGGAVEEPAALENAAFGLPLMYRFRQHELQRFGITARRAHMGGGKMDRRGSPLFLTIRRIGQASGHPRYCVVWCAFDSQFLPDGTVLEVQVGGRKTRVKEPSFDTIRRFLRKTRLMPNQEDER